MGRLSQLFWFINMDEVPTAIESRVVFTHLDTKDPEVKQIRREYRRDLKKGIQVGLFDMQMQDSEQSNPPLSTDVSKNEDKEG